MRERGEAWSFLVQPRLVQPPLRPSGVSCLVQPPLRPSGVAFVAITSGLRSG